MAATKQWNEGIWIGIKLKSEDSQWTFDKIIWLSMYCVQQVTQLVYSLQTLLSRSKALLLP